MKSIATLILATMACSASFALGGGESVTWYKEHKAEREAMVKKCMDDRSKMGTADCKNATAAANELAWANRKPIRSIKPITAEEMKK